MDEKISPTLLLLFIQMLKHGFGLDVGSTVMEWIPPRWQGLPLFCPTTCKSDLLFNMCCNCNSRSAFELDPNPCQANVTTLGEIVDKGCSGNTVLIHKYPKLYKFPDNICKYPRITKIDLSQNYILDIPSLSCLSNLTYLDLSWNKITTLRKVSLVANRNLRHLDLSFNSITHIETGVLESLSFLEMSLSQNLMTSIDVVDVMISRPFCKLDVSFNRLETIVNNNNWTVNMTNNYESGLFNGTYNLMKSFPDWDKLGFPTLTHLGKVIFRAYDIRHNLIHCDCSIVKQLVYFKPVLLVVNREFFDVLCSSPMSLKGQALRNFVENDSISELVCNHTGLVVCPSNCVCVTEPRYSDEKKNKAILVTTITCNKSGLKRLPHILPESDEIQFDFTGNSIQQISNEHYLSRVTVLKMMTMPSFENMAIEKLKNLKELTISREAQLNGIPKQLSILHPCVFLQEEDFVMNCTCSLRWMVDWLPQLTSDKCMQKFKFKCLGKTDNEKALIVLQHMDCNISASYSIYAVLISLSLAVLVMLIISAVVWKQKYEIRLLIRETNLSKLIMKPKITLDQDRVVFISFDGSNQDLYSFILKRLEPFLVAKGFHVFIPPRDLALGSVRCDEAAWQISVSRYYIAFLSLSYLNEGDFETQNEWRCIWNGYMSDNRKELLVLNYDLMKSYDVPCCKMRAVMRVGNVVDFDAGESKILSKIVKLFSSSSTY